MQAFIDRVLDESDRLTMYAHASQNLDSRFSAPRSSLLDPEDQAVLSRIRSDYLEGARECLAGIRSDMQSPLSALESVPKSQTSPIDLTRAALQLDRAINAAFAGAHSELSDKELYSQIDGLVRYLEDKLK